MKIKEHYIAIPLIVILVAIIGSTFMSAGMEWYDAVLIRPSLTPPKWVFPIAWNTIFVCTAISAILIWNTKDDEHKGIVGFLTGLFRKHTPSPEFRLIIRLFILNAILNVFWSFLFFELQNITLAFLEILFLDLSLFLLVYYTWFRSKIASLLLAPYLVWACFATYLNYLIYTLN